MSDNLSAMFKGRVNSEREKKNLREEKEKE